MITEDMNIKNGDREGTRKTMEMMKTEWGEWLIMRVNNDGIRAQKMVKTEWEELQTINQLITYIETYMKVDITGNLYNF